MKQGAQRVSCRAPNFIRWLPQCAPFCELTLAKRSIQLVDRIRQPNSNCIATIHGSGLSVHPIVYRRRTAAGLISQKSSQSTRSAIPLISDGLVHPRWLYMVLQVIWARKGSHGPQDPSSDKFIYLGSDWGALNDCSVLFWPGVERMQSGNLATVTNPTVTSSSKSVQNYSKRSSSSYESYRKQNGQPTKMYMAAIIFCSQIWPSICKGKIKQKATRLYSNGSKIARASLQLESTAISSNCR